MIPNELEHGHPLNKHSHDYLSFQKFDYMATKLNIFNLNKSITTSTLTGDCIRC
jgi:hypothetical protein